MDERQKLEEAIAHLEAQRATLGEAVVEAALAPLRQKLAEIEARGDFPEQQRKQVTILFSDIAGSTKIVSHLDPEEARDLFDSALRRLAEPIARQGGHVTRFMGDGFKAVFGSPQAREDDPERAVRAALGILEVARILADELNASRGIQDFQVRVGVNTGLAALGGTTEAEDTLMGSPINLTARLESAAPPGGILISHDTYRHVRGLFDVQPLPPITAKGFEQPVPVYQVLRAKPRSFRTYLRGVEGVETRLVGRESEFKLLQDALILAVDEGEGQVVTLTGEAGVGKSRLLYEFENWLELQPFRVRYFQGRGRPEAQRQPYALLRDLFAFRFLVQDSDPLEAVHHKIESGFGEILGTDEAGQLRAHFIGQLLGFDFSHSPHLRAVQDDPQQLRDRATIYLEEYFRTLSRQVPAVVTLEDIHWADDSSLDLINQLGRQTAKLHLLIVCLARPALYEHRPYWGEGQPFHTRLELHPLSKAESRQLVAEILQRVEQVPLALRELVVGGVEGNPFYVEELIKMLIEQGVILTTAERWQVVAERLAQVDVPSTLTGVLQARLDSLPRAERTVLQQAAVVGRVFWDRAVAHLSAAQEEGLPVDSLPDLLSDLRGKELVYHREGSAFVGAQEYLFKHALLREVTYESVVRRLRRVYHALVAEWLLAHVGERLGEYAGLIADHLEQAGQSERALPYLIQAGKQAAAAYANQEAESYYHAALELVGPGQERGEVLSELGRVLARLGHFAEAIQTWREAIPLYKEVGDHDQIAWLYARMARAAWWGGSAPDGLNLCQEGLSAMPAELDSASMAHLMHEASRAYWFNDQHGKAVTFCQRALTMARQHGDAATQAEALTTLGSIEGRPAEQALESLQEAVRIAESAGLLNQASRAHNNLGVLLEQIVGDFVQARQHYQRASDLGQQRGAHADYIFSGVGVALCSLFLGDTRQAGKVTQELLQCLMDNPVGKVAQMNAEMLETWLLGSTGELFKAKEILEKLRREAFAGGSSIDEWSYGKNLGFILNEIGEPEIAETSLNEALRAGGQTRSENWPRNTLIEVLLRQGKVEEARQILAESEKEAISKPGFYNSTFLTWSNALLASAERRWDVALEMYAQLSETLEARGLRLWLAQLLREWAEVYLTRREPGDNEQARHLLERALALYKEMEIPYYVEIVKKRLGEVEG